jgi:hydroxyquinol 1,2-dioxygenase
MDGTPPEQPTAEVMQALVARMSGASDTRLADGFLTVVGRLHDLVTALRPTADELRAVIEFLTDVGHSADARRQEWVLLADVIGVSTLVENINAPRPEGATPNTLAGPFYRDDVPEMPCGADLSRDGVGIPMAVQVHVCDLTGRAVPGAMVEVWQANADGRYENQDPDLQPEFNLRGRLRCDGDGRVHFTTIKPAGYALPEDGPTGRLMNALGLRLQRPAHVHFRVMAAGYEVLTTHIFDRNDPAIWRDALFGVKPALLGDFVLQGDGQVMLSVNLVLATARGPA